jgi:hypothetical protein
MSILEARVPSIEQNDARSGFPFRCGAAATQAILYGREDSLFANTGEGELRTGIPVHDDQEAIWRAIKRASRVVARSIRGGEAGRSESHQLCDPGSLPECWATHPDVMSRLLTEGLTTTSIPLAGIRGVAAQTVDEQAVPDVIAHSLRAGVGAALHVLGSHWVVVHKLERRPDQDLAIFFRDPLTRAECVWPTILDMAEAVMDSGRGAQLRDGPQAVLVCATAPADATPPLTFVRQRRDNGPLPENMTDADLQNLLTSELRSMWGAPPADMFGTGAFFSSFSAPISRVLRVRRPARFAEGPAAMSLGAPATTSGDRDYLLLATPFGASIVDASTTTVSLMAIAAFNRTLPRMLDRDALAAELDGRRVRVGNETVTLDRKRFVLGDRPFWQPCDQSRSMLLPFYTLTQKEGAQEYSLFVRVDGYVYSQLTWMLAGA